MAAQILVVDDQRDVALQLFNMLRRENHEVYIASSACQAIHQLEHNKFDFIITDIWMENRYSGYDVLKKAQETNPGVDVILLTGYESATTKIVEAMRLGAIDYIEKKPEEDVYSIVVDKVETQLKLRGFYFGRYHALIIAVEQYNDTKIKNLAYPISDAKSLGNILTQKYCFESSNVKFLNNPNLEAIYHELCNYERTLTREDNLLIFYAGHGQYNEQRKQGYIWPSNAKMHNPAEWLSYGTLRDFIAAINTQHTLIISDACYGGAIFELNRSPAIASDSIMKKYQSPSRRAITSSHLSEVPDKSLFFKYLIHNLEMNNSKYINAASLHQNFEATVVNSQGPQPLYGNIAGVDDDPTGDFIFVRRSL